jgi:hypothetical protein
MDSYLGEGLEEAGEDGGEGGGEGDLDEHLMPPLEGGQMEEEVWNGRGGRRRRGIEREGRKKRLGMAFVGMGRAKTPDIRGATQEPSLPLSFVPSSLPCPPPFISPSSPPFPGIRGRAAGIGVGGGGATGRGLCGGEKERARARRYAEKGRNSEARTIFSVEYIEEEYRGNIYNRM